MSPLSSTTSSLASSLLDFTYDLFNETFDWILEVARSKETNKLYCVTDENLFFVAEYSEETYSWGVWRWGRRPQYFVAYREFVYLDPDELKTFVHEPWTGTTALEDFILGLEEETIVAFGYSRDDALVCPYRLDFFWHAHLGTACPFDYMFPNCVWADSEDVAWLIKQKDIAELVQLCPDKFPLKLLFQSKTLSIFEATAKTKVLEVGDKLLVETGFFPPLFKSQEDWTVVDTLTSRVFSPDVSIREAIRAFLFNNKNPNSNEAYHEFLRERCREELGKILSLIKTSTGFIEPVVYDSKFYIEWKGQQTLIPIKVTLSESGRIMADYLIRSHAEETVSRNKAQLVQQVLDANGLGELVVSLATDFSPDVYDPSTTLVLSTENYYNHHH